MNHTLRFINRQHGWLLLAEGLSGIIFGVLILAWPVKTIGVVVTLSGIFLALSGLIGLFRVIGVIDIPKIWGWHIAASIVRILIGLLLLKWPTPTLIVFALSLGVGALIIGIVGIMLTFVTYTSLTHAWRIGSVSIITFLLGVLLIFWPKPGLLTLVYLAGIYALFYGLVCCVTAIMTRSFLHHSVTEHSSYPSCH